jgi:hypothetical protein
MPKRTTIVIDEKLERIAKRYAVRNGVSFAAVVREALAAYVVEPRRQNTLPSVAGAFESGHTDTSERVHELLRTDPHR